MNGLYANEVQGTAILFYQDQISEIAHFHDRGRRKEIFEKFNKKVNLLKQPHLNQILVIYEKVTIQRAIDSRLEKESRRHKNNKRLGTDNRNKLRMGKATGYKIQHPLPSY